jgi:hypothetical protein
MVNEIIGDAKLDTDDKMIRTNVTYVRIVIYSIHTLSNIHVLKIQENCHWRSELCCKCLIFVC